jgi:hypothetical protein
VQAVSRRCLHRRLGFPAVGEDPRHDRVGIGTCGHDGGPLDDGAAGGMSSGQASEQGSNRFVVHAHHGSPCPRLALFSVGQWEYRQAILAGEHVAELRKRTTPEQLARDLSQDARRRGL